jgi:MFS family permease
MLSSLGMAIGPVVGGWVFDTYHDYRWLYIGSVGLAIVAAAIALAFPKTRAPQCAAQENTKRVPV